jgi:radical SAM superfamily enzyme YgiQ (UPF0313 family)
MSSRSIILTTINARYAHTALGLRWLHANLGPWRDQAVIREFTLAQPPSEIAETLLAENPRILGFGVYIWNVAPVTQVVQTVKSVRPDVTVVLGGPEASYEYEETELFARADYLIQGEADVAFAELAWAILEGRRPTQKLITPSPPDLASLALPYHLYTEEDVARRILYVEASRGCPFQCEFCLSSLATRVRTFPLEPFLDAIAQLAARGARRFRFVDRTFNLDEERVETILRFFQRHWREDMRVHFEIMPDRLGERTLATLAEFPPGGLHLEVGVQTFNPVVLAEISRRQDMRKTEENLHYLRTCTQATLHADLVAGLPGESWESFAAGFDKLVALGPQEIQVGILKRLKGTPIARHTEPHKMVFAPEPPYEILQTDLLDFFQLQRIKRFARYFDLYYNSGNFPRSLDLLWRTGPSRFSAFMGLADALWAATHRTHELSLTRLAQHLYDFLLAAGVDTRETIACAVKDDFYRLPGRRDKLPFLS